MSVGLHVNSQEEFTNYFAVACQFARVFGGTLIVFVSSKEDGLLAKHIRAKIKSRDEDAGNKNPRVRLKPLGEEAWEAQLLKEAFSLNKLLIPYAAERNAELAKLADSAACTTIRIMADERNRSWDRVSVQRDGYRHGSARRAAQQISEVLDACELRLQPFEKTYQENELVLVGTPYNRQREEDDVAEAIRIRSESENPPAVGIVLTGHSVSRRAYAAFENLVQRTIPQMERERRIQLTNDLHVFVTREDKDKDSGSRHTLKEERFDFVSMIGASAALASLGLVQDSAAVIIGAMLVAPLMSPILAGSLAVVHSHSVLFKRSWQMISVGFLFAFLVSFCVGLLYAFVADVNISREMASRCRPGIMDFVIGFAGGGAAAYARTRSQLSSALAGAAIAAALVPPIATSAINCAFLVTVGLKPSDGVVMPPHPLIGPLLLFGMNVLSIMVAASISLWAAGARSYTSNKSEKWWQWGIITLLVLLAVISAAVAYKIDVESARADPAGAVLGERISPHSMWAG
ncbi:MAG: DUF389 domain-containing protein [Planctomycetaceae bacterium]